MDDRMSFEELVKRYEPIIKKQIVRLRIYKDHEEFYQTGLIGLWEAADRYIPSKGKFSTFAIATIRGKMLSLLTEKQKGTELTEALLERKELELFAYDEFPELEYEYILQLLNHLSLSEKKWVLLTIFENKKISEIAAEEGVSVHTVKTWRKRALLKLKRDPRLLHP